MTPTIAFRCSAHSSDHLHLTLFFSDRHPRKFHCGVCEKRTWWRPQDPVGEEVVVTVKKWGTATGGVIFLHRRWIGKRVRIARA